MNRSRFGLFAAAVGLCASIADATPGAKELLSAPVREMARAGFPVSGTAIPEAQAAAVSAMSAQTQAPVDHAAAVLKNFSAEILASEGVGVDLQGAVARQLGFAPTPSAPWNDDGKMPTKGIARRSNSTHEVKSFSATAFAAKRRS